MEAIGMDRLRLILAGIGKNLGGLNKTQMLLMGSLVLIVVLALVLVAQFSSKAMYSPILPGVALVEQQKAQLFLERVGIKTTMVGSNVSVSASDASRAQLLLAESNQLPADKVLLFETLIEKQSVFNSRQQNEQQYRIALMNELAKMISGFGGVKTASVKIDVPEASGLGRQVRQPTASVAVLTSTGQPMTQGLVDAVGALVSGSLAGLERKNVQILDLAAGRARRPQSDEDMSATTYLEHATRIENETQRKIEDLLRYIPGVIVAVTAQVDVTRVTAQVNTNMPDKKGSVSMISKETEETSTSQESSPGAEPGPMSNQTADISRAGGSGAGSKTETTTSTREFVNQIGNRTETIFDPKGYPTRIAVSVNVPTGYVTNLLNANSAATTGANATPTAANAAGPTEDQIKAKFDGELKPAIIAALIPHIRTLMNTSGASLTEEQIRVIATDSVGVSLIPLDIGSGGGSGGSGSFAMIGGAGASSGATASSGGIGSIIGAGGGIVQTAVLGTLAVVALGMMLTMVRKVGKQATMQTAEELVGLPPAIELESQSDLIGEAGESDTAMAGIEVNESELQSQKVLEQVEELVSKNPEATARILNRWLSPEET